MIIKIVADNWLPVSFSSLLRLFNCRVHRRCRDVTAKLRHAESERGEAAWQDYLVTEQVLRFVDELSL